MPRSPAVTRAAAQARERVPLAGYTTLGLGGPAARLIDAATDEEIVSAVRAADGRGEPVLVLGGGSNLVVADEGFPGTVVRVATRGVSLERDADGGSGGVLMTVAAGEDWDGIAGRCVAEGLSGVECLSGIPGLAGATPIQNVGAYGQEVADVVASVRVLDRVTGGITDMPNGACGFGYRTSVFKRSAAGPARHAAGPGEAGHGRAAQGAAEGTGAPGGNATGRFVVLGVTFRLAEDPLSRPVGYPELAAALGAAPGSRVPLADARHAVLGLRARKGMVLDPADPDTRSAGSFFTNPVLSEGQFAAVEAAARARCGPGTRVPRFPAGGGRLKVPAAWLIEHAGFRKGYPGTGHRRGAPDEALSAGGTGCPGTGSARISTKHTLALVNPGGATTAGLLALAREIRDGVRETFGVTLVPEPVLVGVTL